MRYLQLVALSSAVMLCVTSGCNEPAPAQVSKGQGQESKEQTTQAENDPRFHERLLEIAAEYQGYGLVDPRAFVAPENCAAPSSPRVPVSLSQSDHASTHGKKLYFLFAKDEGAYVNGTDEEAAAEGQVIVKESWSAMEFKSDEIEGRKHASGHEVLPFAVDGDKTYTTGKQRDLFIMFRTNHDAPGTDNGWVYGTVTTDDTVTTDGKQVTSAGVVETCAGCHRTTGDERLFGLEGSRARKGPPLP